MQQLLRMTVKSKTTPSTSSVTRPMRRSHCRLAAGKQCSRSTAASASLVAAVSSSSALRIRESQSSPSPAPTMKTTSSTSTSRMAIPCQPAEWSLTAERTEAIRSRSPAAVRARSRTSSRTRPMASFKSALIPTPSTWTMSGSNPSPTT